MILSNSTIKTVVLLFTLSLAPTTFAKGFTIRDYTAFQILRYVTRWAEIFVLLRQGLNHMMTDKSPVKQTFSDKNFKNYAGTIDQNITQIVESIKNSQIHNLPNGILLHGDPGTGKTLLAECIAGEIGCPLFDTTAAQFNNSSDGGGESLLRGLFDDARKAAGQHGTAIIFIDEFDAFGKRNKTESEADNSQKDNPKKNGVITTLLNLLDNRSNLKMYLHKHKSLADETIKTHGSGLWATTVFYAALFRLGIDGQCKTLYRYFHDIISSYLPFMNSKKGPVIVIGATNYKDKIDEALIRSGRFDYIVKLKLPDKDDRKAIISHYIPNDTTEELKESIACITEDWSAADIKNLIESAQNRTQDKKIERKNFAGALLRDRKKQNTTPATKNDRLKIVNKYENDAAFANDCNYDDILDNSTKKMPIECIVNIFEKAKLHAKHKNSVFVFKDHLQESMIDVKKIFKEQKEKRKKSKISVLTTLYPCSATTDQLFSILHDKKTLLMIHRFDNAYKNKKSDKITFQEIQY